MLNCWHILWHLYSFNLGSLFTSRIFSCGNYQHCSVVSRRVFLNQLIARRTLQLHFLWHSAGSEFSECIWVRRVCVFFFWRKCISGESAALLSLTLWPVFNPFYQNLEIWGEKKRITARRNGGRMKQTFLSVVKTKQFLFKGVSWLKKMASHFTVESMCHHLTSNPFV